MAGPVENLYTPLRLGLSGVGLRPQGLVRPKDLAGGVGGGVEFAFFPVEEKRRAPGPRRNALTPLATAPQAKMTHSQQRNRPRVRCLLSALLLNAALLSAPALAQVGQLTHHNDAARSGANLSETQLTTANVNVGQFGKLFSYPVDADIYAQPLVVPGIAIPGKGTHTVLYVTTMNNSVYAFDADTNQGANAQPLWQVNFNNPAAGITPVPVADVQTGQNIRNPGPIGVMGTPVIDPASRTLYLVARTKENGTYVQRLHALDLSTGAEKLGGPKVITASVAGTGNDNVGGVVSFNPKWQNQRPGLALANGIVYIAWSSHEDTLPYHGWVMGYDAATLAQTGALNVSPDGAQGGIWQSGQPPAIDANGNLYLMTGNGSFDGTRNFGESIVKLNAGLGVQDWFTPDNWQALNNADADLGSSGVLLIPGTNQVIGGGKSGTFFLLDRNNLGHTQSGNGQIAQHFQATSGGHIHGGPVYWSGPAGPWLYVWGEQDFLKAFAYNSGTATFNPTPVSQSPFTAPPGMPGGFLSLSANGAQAGSAILWAALPFSADAEDGIATGVLHAFDASDLSQELWNSQINPARDSLGNFAKYVPPTIANGRLYLASFSHQVHVYGLLGSLPVPTGGALAGSSVSSTAAVDLSAVGTADWAHWPGYEHKASGAGQLSDSTVLGGTGTVYGNDLRTMSWSDGLTAPSGANTQGVFVAGTASGFSFSAPADTATRTLTLYGGGFNSRGMLSAHLSDGSAPDFVDTTPSGTGQYDAVYTLTYQAASAGQQLTVQWTQFSGAGNVTLQGAALAGGGAPPPPPPAAPLPPTALAASDGTSPTQVSLAWNASANATSYTVYRSTAAGTQGSAIGTVASPGFTDTTALAGTLYYYAIVATGPGGSSALSAQDTGFVAGVPPTGGGSLLGSVAASSETANLTNVGTDDWAHWPGYDHKASGGSLISNYTQIGSNAVFTYGNDPRRLIWGDGTPTASGSTITGIYISDVGNGFLLTAPADTTPRTLTVYVGGWKSGGKLTARLSDGSAADYTNASLASTGQYNGVYALTYKAAISGQQLRVEWTQLSGAGNVTLQAGALSGAPLPPPPMPATPSGVNASDGTSTSSVTVTWSAAANAASYTVYRSTVAGTRGSSIGTATGTSLIDATPSPGTTYYYGVTATGSGGTSALSAQDTGYAATPPAGSVLSGQVAASSAAVSLSATGVTDWAHWPGYDHKVGGASLISTYTKIGNGVIYTYPNDLRTVSWNDGTPNPVGSNAAGVYIAGVGNGFAITAPADTTTRTLVIYVGGWWSGGKLTAHLSNGTAADYIDTSISGNAQYNGVYTLTYKAQSAGQQLSVTWTQSSGFGNVTLQGAALK
jgi:hypothetical protein